MFDTQNAQPVSTDTGSQTAPTSTPSSASTPTAAPSLDEMLSKVYDEAMKPADAPVKNSVADPDQASAQPTTTAETTGEPDPAAEDQPEPIRPPSSWSADNQKWFSQLSRQHQEYIAKREAEAHQKITQQGAETRQWQPVRQVFDEFRHAVPQGKEAETVRNLLAAQAFIDSNPLQGVLKLAEVYGVNREQFAQALGFNANVAPQTQAQQAATDQAIDDLFRDPRIDKSVMPVLQQIQQQNQALQQKLFHMEQEAQRRASAETSQRVRSIESQISDFARDKSDWGAVAKHVMGEIALLKQENPGLDAKSMLEMAYDRARWKDPEIRQRIQEDQRKTEEAKAARERAKAAQEAKKLAGMNVRTGAAASSANFDGRWDADDALSAIYDRVNAS